MRCTHTYTVPDIKGPYILCRKHLVLEEFLNANTELILGVWCLSRLTWRRHSILARIVESADRGKVNFISL